MGHYRKGVRGSNLPRETRRGVRDGRGLADTVAAQAPQQLKASYSSSLRAGTAEAAAADEVREFVLCLSSS